LSGPLWLLRRCLPLLGASTGTLVHLLAAVAEQPLPGLAAYSATKTARTAADVALDRELRRVKVRLLDVRPPPTDTGLADRPIHGVAPPLPTGLTPHAVARRLADALAEGRGHEPAADFDDGT